MAKSSSKNSTAQMTEHLKKVLSDTYVLMVKTHGFHWNVTGNLFPQLHAFLETQYNELFEAADSVAEQIRKLDMLALGTMGDFLKNTVVKEASNQNISAPAMLKDLLKTHEQVRARVFEACEFAGEIEDKTTEDLMIERLHAHDKAMWMIRSQVEKS